MRQAAALWLVLLVACARSPGPGAANGQAGKLNVVASVSVITNLVENVGGDAIALTGVVPEGVNSHTFEPTPGDTRLLAKAGLIFLNGLHLEERIAKLARTNLKREAGIVELGGSAVTRDEWIFDFSFPKDRGDPNPHLWTNPLYAKRFALTIKDRLSEADPANSEKYSSNYSRFAERIDLLDRAARSATASLPPEKRKLLTYHDSFPYFAREYGWTVIGAIQPSDFSEPTPREIAALIDQIKEQKIPAIFGSEVFPSKILEQIARETGARYVDDLRDDDLPGEKGDGEHSYIGLMKFDLITIVEALGGDASELRRVDGSNLMRESADYRR